MRDIIACLLLAPALLAGASRTVAVITEGQHGAPASHGLAKLKEALQAKGITVADATAARTANFVVLANPASRCTTLPRTREALSIGRGTYEGKPAVILCGSETRGLMYAALDTADRVNWSRSPSDPFQYRPDRRLHAG